ncbi:IclR family transcriptional regulator [Haloarchaeobius sp. TZWSO28]|uniref:IclR family transcriptional regulator n=1 Tax=Haloarchaeobius sp. TZWSO28 TaxID=3446119 RepID=UPI003EBD5430
MAAPPDNTINSVRTTFDILECLQRRGGAGVTEVATDLGISKGTVHNHLSTLLHEEYIVKTVHDTYEIGLRFLDLAHEAKRRITIYDLVKNEVDKLAEASGEMALFTVEEHGLGVCVYRAMGPDSVQTPLYVGQRNELHHTAVGKAILANLPAHRIEEIIETRGLTAQTADTITDKSQLLEELATVREKGFAFNDGETIKGLIGVSAPIFEPDGTVVGAISIIGPSSRMDEDRFYGEIPDMITRSVNIIQINATSL